MATKKRDGTPVEQTAKDKDDKPYVGATVPVELLAKLKAEAERQGVAPAAVIRQALAAFLSGEKVPVRAVVVDELLAKIEGRVADLDRKIDSCAIAAVRVGDRVQAIMPTPKA